MEMPDGWNERKIAAALARQTFASRYLVMLPNCSWTGNECDLLVVTENLRIIDVEIKISIKDWRADSVKQKWYHYWDSKVDGPRRDDYRGRPRLWPSRVWKHYYCVPADLWVPECVSLLPSNKSGVITVEKNAGSVMRAVKVSGDYIVRVVKPAKPNKDASPINDRAAIDLARLASLRMWDALNARVGS